jgi:hypothetical protein
MITGKLCCVRILGFLLLNEPNRDVHIEVTKCILSCEDDSDLVNLGSFFERYVILPCEFFVCHSPLPACQIYVLSCPVKKYKGRTLSSSQHPSRPSFEDVKSQVKVNISEAPKNHKDAKDRVSTQAQLCSLSCSHYSPCTGSHLRQLEMCCNRFS